ncbi:MAG TPA: nicotinate-nucleotide adenylyltransferase [Thermodesulfobacteriota bacterium]|nr:nicotinate-nucleotide adenylyltransferase [Thermodesulfobacteriota bacterium]
MTAAIGVMGGTFDPVHLGHLRGALEVAEALGLPEVRFVPARVPPHKPDEPLAPAEHRVAMLRLAIRGQRRFRLDLRELERPGPSYTIDTIRSYLAEGLRPTFIMGLDAYLGLATWHDYEALLSACDHAVMTRPGYPVRPLEETLPLAVARRFWYDPAAPGYRHESGAVIRFVPVTQLAISSTGVRETVRAGRSIAYLVPHAVEQYIRSRRLYEGGNQRSG